MITVSRNMEQNSRHTRCFPPSQNIYTQRAVGAWREKITQYIMLNKANICSCKNLHQRPNPVSSQCAESFGQMIETRAQLIMINPQDEQYNNGFPSAETLAGGKGENQAEIPFDHFSFTLTSCCTSHSHLSPCVCEITRLLRQIQIRWEIITW